MSLSHILSKFDALGVFKANMPIQIDQDFTGSAEFMHIYKSVFNTDNLTITAKSAQRDGDGASLRIVGTASLLSLENAVVIFTAGQMNGDFLTTLEITIPQGWLFSTSFPELPGYIDRRETDERKQNKSTFLDQLSWGASKLIFTNIAHESDGLGIRLVPGLNFQSELFLMGALKNLGRLTGTDQPVRIAGPVIEYRENSDPLDFPGIRLSGEMALEMTHLGPFAVNGSRILLKGSYTADQTDFSLSFTRRPGIYLFTGVTIGGRDAEMIGRFDFTAPDPQIVFSIRFTDYEMSGFSNLSQDLQIEGLAQQMPQELPAPEGVRLTELGLGLDLNTLAVFQARLAVGTQMNWQPMEGVDFSISEVGAAMTVRHPFNAKARQFEAMLSGLFALGDMKLGAFVDLPAFRLGLGLPRGDTLPLGTLLKKLMPNAPELPAMTVTDLDLVCEPREKRFAMDLQIEDVLSIPVGATAFEILGIGMFLNYDKSNGGMTGAMAADMAIADASFYLSGRATDVLTLSGTLRNFQLQRFFNLVTGGDALPEEVPDILFETLKVEVTPAAGDFSITGSAMIEWDRLPFDGAITTSLEFSLAVDKTKTAGASKTAIQARLSLQGTGPAGFTDDFIMKSFNFLFDYQTGQGWALGGGATVEIFDHELYVQAGYKDSKTLGRTFQLNARAEPEVKLISLTGIGYYSFSQLDLSINRKAVKGRKSRTCWDLRLDSTLAVSQVFTMAGFLSIFDREDGRKGLLFNPDPGTAAAKIDFPGLDGGGARISLFEAGFTKESAESGWGFTATVDVAFTGMPGWLDDLLPAPLHARMVAAGKEVRISAVRVTDILPVTLPKMGDQPMGTLYFQLTEVGLAVKPAAGLVLEAGLGFSSEVNNLFGGATIFRVYEKDNPLSLARTRFTINASGVSAQLVTSPFAGANAVVVNGESWFDVDLGSCGALRLKMPTFKYDGVTQYFEAGGGAEVTRPLAIPVKPIKTLLREVDLKAAADVLPDSIPIQSVDIVDDQGDFKIDALIKLLESAGKLPGEIKDLLYETGDLLDRFPDTFKQYFNIVVPEKLEFKFGFSPTGRLVFGLKTGETPIRVLQPAMVQGIIPMPGLNGIELREISLGTLSGGSLFRMTIDGHIDTYDMATLALSLVLPSDKSFPLPTSDELQRRLVLKNLFMIIPLQAGVPIPIPVFYDQVAVEYYGIEGVGLQGHIGLPAPQLSGLPRFFSTLKQFFSDRDYLLDPRTSPGIDLKFNLADNYFRLPEYLGGNVLGMKGKPVTISAWSGLAHALNFMKTISLNELIQAIPIEHRVGSADCSFAFLNFNSDWLITTPKEFRDGAYKKMKLSPGDKEDFVAVLPTVAASASRKNSGDEQGLVVFLRGEADLGIVGLETVFGLAASGSMGFATGFKFSGTLAKAIEIEMAGAVAVNAPAVDASGSLALPEPSALPPADAVRIPAGTPLALAFDGSTSAVWVPDHGALNFKGAFTIETWVKFSAFDKPWQAVVTKGDGSWRLHRFQSTNRIAFSTSGLSNCDLAGNRILKAGQWYHIAAVYNGKRKLLYINGELDNAVDVTGKLNTGTYSAMIGANAQRPGREFNGQIGEVRIWNAARSKASIQDHRFQKLSGKEPELAGCWRFDPGCGHTAVDICGRLHGIMQAPAWRSCDLLNRDGLAFNGSNGHVELPGLNIDFSRGLTIEAWVWYDSLKKWSRVIDFGNGANKDNILFANQGATRNLCLSIRRGTAEKHLVARGVLDTGKWMHLAATVDEKGSATLYKNGKAVQTGTVHLPKSIQRTKNFIGRSNWPQDGYFHGRMDDVRIWNTARGASQIQEACTKQLSGTESGLAACWPFRRGFGSAAEDIAGSHHGRLRAATWQVPAQAGNAAEISGLTFDGAGTCIEVPDNAALRLARYTVECWIKPQQPAAWAGIVGKPGRNFNIWLHKDGFIHHRFKAGNNRNAGAPNTPKGSIKWNQWNHVAITNDGKTARTFINGIQAASGPTGGAVAVNKTALQIGRSCDGKPSAFYRGSLAQVRIWNTARSAAAIRDTKLKRLGGKETGLKCCWPMDEGGGDLVQDTASNLDGRVRQPCWTEKTKMIPNGLAFDGRDDSVQIPDSDSLRIARYTVECWIKPEKPAAWAGLVGKPGGGFNVWLHKDGFIRHRFKARNNKIKGPPDTAKGSIKWGRWTHVAVTNDGKTAQTFINGRQAASGAAGGVPPGIKKAVIIGQDLGGRKKNYFKGSMDEIRIWSHARSADQIQGHMHRYLAGSEAGLCGYWKMDRGFGNRLLDSAGNGNPGTIRGASWTLVSSPDNTATQTAAIQIFGHTHLDMLGHRILSGDIRLIDDVFWFRGMLNLFPANWPIKVYGDVEGLISRDDFKVAGEVDTALAGLNLASAKILLTRDETRIEGTVFGVCLVLELLRKGGKSTLNGSLGFDFNIDLHFGAIKIGKVKVADGVEINCDIGFDLAIGLSQSGFKARVRSKFTINGKGFDLTFTIGVAPNRIEDVLEEIKKKILDAPLDYIGDMFSDAAKWLEDVGKGAIQFIDNTGEEIGRTLNKTFAVAEGEVTKLMKDAGRSGEEIAHALGTGYKKGPREVARLMKNGRMVADDVGKGLKSAFNSTGAEAAKALKSAGYVADDVGKALKGTFTNSTNAAAKALKDAGYVADDVGKALKGTFSNSADTVGKALSNAGYQAGEVGKVMKKTFNKSAKDVAKFMKNTLKLGESSINSALKGAGYAASEVKDALGDAFNWAKKNLDPRNWF